MLFYGKMTPDRADVALVAVNLDPFATHAAWLDIPTHEIGLAADQLYRLHERLTNTWQDVRGPWLRVTLDPQQQPAVIFSVHRA